MCYRNWGIKVVQNGYFEIVVLENSSQVFDSDPYESPRPWPPLQVPVTYYRGDFPARRLPSNALKIVYYFPTGVLLVITFFWLLQLVNCTTRYRREKQPCTVLPKSFLSEWQNILQLYNWQQRGNFGQSTLILRAQGMKKIPPPLSPRIKRLSFDIGKGIGFVI